jgi:hypothetical protein
MNSKVDKNTHAVLKQPPRAPARAAAKGVSCGRGFDCTDMEEEGKGATVYRGEEQPMMELEVIEPDG